MIKILALDKLLNQNNVQGKSIENLCICYEKDIIGRLKQKMEAAAKEQVKRNIRI